MSNPIQNINVWVVGNPNEDNSIESAQEPGLADPGYGNPPDHIIHATELERNLAQIGQLVMISFENMRNDLDENMPVHNVPAPDPAVFPSIEAKPIIVACAVCKVNQVQTVNLPCMHACMCTECAHAGVQYYTNCPQCRTPLEKISVLYLSYTN
jgi:hypothetical protein